jgi:hypothetical protein
VPAPTAEELHAEAESLRRAEGLADPAAEQFSAAVASTLDGRVIAQRRPLNWITSLHRYEDHWRRFGRTPRENTRARTTLSDEERHLGEWARYQRRFEGGLNAYQRARLDVSPAFNWDPLERGWNQRFEECERYVATHSALPRLRAADASEFVLARWLGRQLLRLQNGRLESNRADDLHRLLRTARRAQ